MLLRNRKYNKTQVQGGNGMAITKLIEQDLCQIAL